MEEVNRLLMASLSFCTSHLAQRKEQRWWAFMWTTLRGRDLDVFMRHRQPSRNFVAETQEKTALEADSPGLDGVPTGQCVEMGGRGRRQNGLKQRQLWPFRAAYPPSVVIRSRSTSTTAQ